MRSVLILSITFLEETNKKVKKNNLDSDVAKARLILQKTT